MTVLKNCLTYKENYKNCLALIFSHFIIYFLYFDSNYTSLGILYFLIKFEGNKTAMRFSPHELSGPNEPRWNPASRKKYRISPYNRAKRMMRQGNVSKL